MPLPQCSASSMVLGGGAPVSAATTRPSDACTPHPQRHSSSRRESSASWLLTRRSTSFVMYGAIRGARVYGSFPGGCCRTASTCSRRAASPMALRAAGPDSAGGAAWGIGACCRGICKARDQHRWIRWCVEALFPGRLHLWAAIVRRCARTGIGLCTERRCMTTELLPEWTPTESKHRLRDRTDRLPTAAASMRARRQPLRYCQPEMAAGRHCCARRASDESSHWFYSPTILPPTTRPSPACSSRSAASP